MSDTSQANQQFFRELHELRSEVAILRRSCEKLGKENERLRLMFQGADDGFWDWPDGNVDRQWWSPRFYELLGYEDGAFEPTLERFVELLHPDDREDYVAAIDLLLTRHEPFDFECRLRAKSGEYRWFCARGWASHDDQDKVAHIAGSARDITERKQANGTLCKTEQLFRTVADYTYDWEYWRSPKGEVVYISPSCERITGYSPAEFVANPELFAEIIHPKDRALWRDHDHFALSAGETCGELQFRICTKAGEKRWIGHSCRAIYDEEGKFLGIRGSNRDVTERKQAEEKLARQAATTEATNEVFRETLSCETEEDLGKTCLAVAERLTGSKFGFLGELNATGLMDTIAISNPGWGACEMAVSDARERTINMPLRGIDRSTLREGKSRIVNGDELATHPDRVGAPEGHPPITAFLGVPLRHKGKVVGMIGLGNKESGYNTADQDSVERLAVAIVESLRSKRAEQALRESERRIRHIVESFPIVLASSEAGTNRTSLMVGDTVSVMGHEPERFYADPDFGPTIIHPEDAERVRKGFAEGLASGQPFELECRIVHGRTGQPLSVHQRVVPILSPDGTLQRHDSIILDITRRKRVEEELRQEKQVLDDIISCLPGLFYAFDGERGMTRWNPQVESVLGYGPEELRGRRPEDFFDDKDKGAIEEAVRRAMTEGHASVEAPVRTKDGDKIPYHWTGARISIEGRPHLIGIGIDISERKRVEEERRAFESQLRHAQKMEAVGELAGGVAHDFNNMLFAILTTVELLQLHLRENGKDNQDDLDLLGQITSAVDKASDLTGQLLAFGRKQATRPKVLGVNDLIADGVRMFRRMVSEDVSIRTLSSPKPCRVWADPTQLSQVLMNLVVNARDAMSDGGELTIEAANVDLDEAYTAAHVGVKPGEYVCLRVRDTGCGMDEEIRNRMFEPFYTTKPVGKGSGLGLAVVYGIVEQTGGHITVDTEPGKGTTISVLLPAASGEEVDREEPETAAKPVTGEATLLVCEDEDAVRRSLCEVLRTVGFKVVEARDGREALDVAASYDGSIDVLITDVVMPEMGGPELAKALRERHPDLRVLYMSGYAPAGGAARIGLEEGARFVEKPCRTSKLLEHLSELLPG